MLKGGATTAEKRAQEDLTNARKQLMATVTEKAEAVGTAISGMILFFVCLLSRAPSV